MKKRLILIVAVAIVLSAIKVFAQEKPDSTLYKYHIKEFKLMQKQLEDLETAKVEITGVLKYHYAKVLEEQKKLKTINDKKEIIKNEKGETK